jgi:hypothetical protein
MSRIKNSICALLMVAGLSSCDYKHKEYSFNSEINDEKVVFEISGESFYQTNVLNVEPVKYTPNDVFSYIQEKTEKKFIDDKRNDLIIDSVCSRTFTINDLLSSEYSMHLSNWSCHEEPEILAVAQTRFDNYLSTIRDVKQKADSERLEEIKEIYTK